MSQTVGQQHIVSDAAILGGEPIVDGTRTPVRAVVELWRMGVPPEEIPRRLPHLTLAKSFAALSYYSDQREEIDDTSNASGFPLSDSIHTVRCRERPVHGAVS